MLRPLRSTLLASALAACDGADGGGKNTLEDTAAGPACGAWTYDDTPTEWSLPPGSSTGAFTRTVRDAADCEGGLPATRLLDLTGDARPDLVQLSDCGDPAVGDTAWRVWPGVEGGFGDEIGWALPGGHGASAFAALRDAADCSGEGDLPASRLLDLDGDLRLDLVVTELCEDTTLAGAWRVHLNTGAGFDAAEDWPISSAFSTGSFTAPRATKACDGLEDRPAWGVTDIDGDGPVDILLVDECDDDTAPRTAWQHLANDGAGFATHAVAWAVPPDLQANALERSEADCAGGRPDYFLLDVAGDLRPDLVVPRPCTGQGSDWTVYENEGVGFAAVGSLRRAPWALNFTVDRPERQVPECASLGLPAWVMDDADGDRDADLTFTASCADPTVGDTRWDLHAGAAEGWSAATPIALPTGYSSGTFSGGRGDTVGCGGSANRPAWDRRDLDGDGAPEIVVTEACDDAAVGTETWRVYTLRCLDR